MHKENHEISSNIFKYAEITETVIGLDNSKKLNTVWDTSFFDNSMKTFVFKLHNNQLGTNTRVSHFVRGHNRACTFCTINLNEEDNNETISHLFFDCMQTENLLEQFYSRIFNVDYRMATRSEYFVGFQTACESDNKLLDLLTLLAKKFIWDCKLRYTIPTIVNLSLFIEEEILRIKKQSKKVTRYINSCAFLAQNRNFRF